MATQFGGQIDTPGVTLAQAQNGLFGYRVSAITPTGLGLVIVGPSTSIGGSTLDLQGSPLYDTTAHNPMDAAALDTGLGPINASVSTLFYVYYCFAGDFSTQSPPLGFSTTAPTLLNGIYVLGAAGAAASCFLIGVVYLDAAGNMQDTTTKRTVVNWYNRRQAILSLAPGYNNNNAATTFALTANVWARLNGGTGDTAEWISNGEDPIQAVAWFTLGAAAPAAVVQVGIGDNSNTTPAAVASFGALALNGSSTAVTLALAPAVGRRTLTLLGYTANLATTFQADEARNGSAADPQATGLYALVPV